MEDYQVGQIIFLIGEKSTRVLPIQVIEEVVRTTVDGKIKTYTVKLPDQGATTADIYSLKGTLFKDKEEVRSYMMSNARNAINSMIEAAVDKSREVFEYEEQLPPQEPPILDGLSISSIEAPSDDVQIKKEDGIIKVDLGNGQFAKMKSSSLDEIKPQT